MLSVYFVNKFVPFTIKGTVPFKIYSFNFRNWVIISNSSVNYEYKLLIQNKFKSLKGLINLNYSRCLEVKCILSCWQRTAQCGYFWWSIWCNCFLWQIVIGWEVCGLLGGDPLDLLNLLNSLEVLLLLHL